MKIPVKNKAVLIILALLFVLTLNVWVLKEMGFGIVYQSTDSMPKGWYVYTPVHFPLERNQIVVFKLTPYWQQYIVEHHWMVPDSLLMKPIVGIPGDKVCVYDHQVWINGQPDVLIVSDYAPGKPLPILNFCRELKPGEYFMMSHHIPRSFDSRYFGPIDQSQMVGLVHTD